MPRVNHKSKRRRTCYTPRHLESLRVGFDFFGLFTDEQARRTAWELFRDQILTDWIRGQPDGEPGTRPPAWWEFDAPERRRRLDGKPHPFDNPERTAQIERHIPAEHRSELFRLWFGMPSSLIVPDDFAAVFESEVDYITRLDLLLPGETV